MTSSTASSAASALANEMGPGGYFVGMDEAGYGPNLGPLLVSLTRWRTPNIPGRCNFYRLLKDVVDVDAPVVGRKIHLADSKVVFCNKDGFKSLETSALVLLRSIGWDTTTFQTVWRQLIQRTTHLPDDGEAPLPPWYDCDLPLPIAADPDEVDALTTRLQRRMEKCGLQLIDIRSDLVIEERFNRLTELDGSKGLLLSRVAFKLLRSVWHPDGPDATMIVGDKHGGRNRYDELLAEVLDNHMIFRVEERREVSRYRVGITELRFQVQGEEHLPVACASIVSKYMRELAMDIVNQFWAQHCPDVKPTRGYPGDARRFREQIQAAITNLNLPEHVFWRNR